MLLNDVDTIKKKELLGISGELSDVEKRYSLNALRIFKERYLLKDNDGNTVERLDDLFKRVAVASGIMEVLYDPELYDKEGKQTWDYSHNLQWCEKELKKQQEKNSKLDYKDLFFKKYKLGIVIGGFNVNPFHYECLLSRYIELLKEGKIRKEFNFIINTMLHDMTDPENSKFLPIIQKYYDLMTNGIFLPNTPALMNAGTKLNMNAACFCLDMEDSIDGIGKTCADIMKVFKSGGGIGINYSKLRPEGAYVKSTGGVSSGTISFLKLVDMITGTVAQAGKRRGASMGILDLEHKDIEKFIELKDNKTLENHNISICTPDSFFKGLLSGGEHERYLMDKITKNVHLTGDPGMVFLENMNSNNLLKDIMESYINVTNPCSEIPQYPNESCILASINLTKFVSDGKFDLEKFIDVSITVTAFLDGIIDATKYPIPEINEMTKKCRRVGTGFMGLANVMTMLKIPYNSKEGFLFAEFISAVMTMSALLESNRQAKVKGAFPLWYDEKYPKDKLPVNSILNGKETIKQLKDKFSNIYKYFSYQYLQDNNLYDIIMDSYILLASNGSILRNCSVTTIAPTGTLSMFADCSSALEPNFSNGFIKKVTLGEFEYVNHYLKDALEKEGIYSKQLADKIIKENGGSVQGIEEIPEWIRQVFVTAMDIHPFDHIMMQSVCQRWISNGIAKTINVPEDFDEKLIEYCYVLSWALGNKGVTVYRDNSKDVQVLNNTSKHKRGILDTSWYTFNHIRNLINIPKDYYEQLRCACFPSRYIYNPEADNLVNAIFNDIVEIRVTGDETEQVLECSSCGAVTKVQENSKACFLCFQCGSKIGSCE